MTHDSLAKLQALFQIDVLHGRDGMLAHIRADAKPNAAARLAIYTKGYRLRLLEALATDFPALHTLAGDALFERLGRDYIDAHPATHFSIRYFGRHLSHYLATKTPYRDTPALGEMAALEWALTLAFDAADDIVLPVEALAALPPEAWPEMRLHFHAALQRHDFHWNVPELWSAIDQQQTPEPPRATPHARPWLIWRYELQNYFRPLESDEAWALDSLRGGANFAAMCSGLCDYLDVSQVGRRAAGFLKSWVQAGLVTEIY